MNRTLKRKGSEKMDTAVKKCGLSQILWSFGPLVKPWYPTLSQCRSFGPVLDVLFDSTYLSRLSAQLHRKRMNTP